MARFLTTIPSNSGFYNLGSVQAYPTGGTGPTAFGPTSYYGSDPKPSEPGDSIYTAIDLGDFSTVFRSVELKSTHGGLTRKQTTFYKLKLSKAKSIQFTQNFDQFSLTENTNRNTLLAFYKLYDDNRREELPINNLGYVSPQSSIDYNETTEKVTDYPTTRLDPGAYLFLITNDIRYQETNYSISINVSVTDWQEVNQAPEETLDFKFVADGAEAVLDFGNVRD
jgi:hypothetical protein|tara:strand:- start:208 stop:879 length:672 start_codon:yes stop_codon:yes gene_type:complete